MAILRRDKALEFALHHHKNVRGERLEFKEHFYMLDILADPSPRTIIMSSVQTGKSETFIAKSLADCSLGLSVFYVLPTQDSRNIFVHNRVDRLFDMVNFYNSMMKEGLGSSDSVSLKHIGDGVARFGASQSIQEFKEFPADVLYVDEYDFCDPEGLSFAFDRCKGSPYRYTHYLSNPTFPGNEYRQNIDYLFQNSDAKKISYKCNECGHVQSLEWVGNIVRRVLQEGVVVDWELIDEEWTLDCGRDIQPVCINCGEFLIRDNTCIGWVPVGNPNHPVSGYHISRLNISSDDLWELWERFRLGVNNPTKMKTFYNSDLGLPYAGGVGNRMTEELFGRCVEQYEMPIDPRGPCSMGIDVGSTFDVRISDYVIEDRDNQLMVRRRLIFAGKIITMDELYRLIAQYKVAVAVIDAAPELHKAKEFQLKAPCRVWRCQYHPTEGSNPRSIRWDDGGASTKSGSKRGVAAARKQQERLVWADRTEAMDGVYAQYVNRQVIEPPIFLDLLGGKYWAEHTAPTRVIDKDTERFSWLKCNDHAFHANVYDWLASQDPYGGFLSTSNKRITRGRKALTVRRSDYLEEAERIERILSKTRVFKRWKDITG